jgi:hypothetical protein
VVLLGLLSPVLPLLVLIGLLIAANVKAARSTEHRTTRWLP